MITGWILNLCPSVRRRIAMGDVYNLIICRYWLMICPKSLSRSWFIVDYRISDRNIYYEHLNGAILYVVDSKDRTTIAIDGCCFHKSLLLFLRFYFEPPWSTILHALCKTMSSTHVDAFNQGQWHGVKSHEDIENVPWLLLGNNKPGQTPHRSPVRLHKSGRAWKADRSPPSGTMGGKKVRKQKQAG